MKTIVKNSWYVAAFSDDVVHSAPLGRRIVGEPVVFYRKNDGTVVALEDRCPHRRMPLSAGRISEDDKLICAYHGLTFDGGGKCVLIPGQPSPCDLRIRSYPIVERSGLVWIWMGAPENADDQKICDTSWLDRPGWKTTKLSRYVKANYLLVHDNLADLLHVAYLHIPSGAGNDQMGDAELTFTPNESGYDLRRVTRNIPSPASYARMANPKKNIDRWHIAEFRAPGHHRIHTGVAEVDTGMDQSTLPVGQGRWSISPHHFITPETEQTTHYFCVIGHEWNESTDSWRFLSGVIDEDMWAIEKQQVNINYLPEAPIYPIPTDMPLFTLRRMIAQMVAAEEAAESSSKESVPKSKKELPAGWRKPD